LPAENKSFFFL